MGYLGKICAILRREAGHDFRHYKQSTLVRRVRRRMTEARSASIYAYVESLNNDTKEVEQLFRDLLISVTHFFRDPEAFACITRSVEKSSSVMPWPIICWTRSRVSAATALGFVSRPVPGATTPEPNEL